MATDDDDGDGDDDDDDDSDDNEDDEYGILLSGSLAATGRRVNYNFAVNVCFRVKNIPATRV